MVAASLSTLAQSTSSDGVYSLIRLMRASHTTPSSNVKGRCRFVPP